MVCAEGRIRDGFRYGALGLTALLVATAFTGNADARSRRHHHHRVHSAERYRPATASIVVDANSGAVMEADNADSPRHPASLTKVMTLYLLFEQLDAGKIKLSTEMPVSEHAAAQAPSKLELKPGQSISVGTAIRAIVTKSANDVAVVVAEAVGGDEANFGKMMTAKAHALGMMHTNYHNASGLPDDKQITTARDQAILARAIQDRFPNYYHYFATRTFEYRGHAMRNHNHLLGRIAGVDGIKTGYIHDSGFNIIVSMRRGGRHIVAVVFGGRSASARDARAVDLIEGKIKVASAKRTAPPVVEGWELAARTKESAKGRVAAAVPLPPSAPPRPGSTAAINPTPVKTFLVQPGTMQTASLAAPPVRTRSLRPAPAKEVTVTTVATVKREPPPTAVPEKIAVANVPLPAAAPEPSAKQHTGWLIQVGAFDNESEAKERLAKAKTVDKALGSANPFTEPVAKGDKTLYRARFAGLEKSQAETACKHLRRKDIPCMLLKD
jgi:D-alanyl-D-alanine carboxypeptidase